MSILNRSVHSGQSRICGGIFGPTSNAHRTPDTRGTITEKRIDRPSLTFQDGEVPEDLPRARRREDTPGQHERDGRSDHESDQGQQQPHYERQPVAADSAGARVARR